MSDFLPAYSDSDSDPDSDTESCEIEQKESYDSTAIIDTVETPKKTSTSSVPILKWMNPEESASSSSEDEGSNKLKSDLHRMRHSTLTVKPVIESSVRNPNSLQNLMITVKDRPSFLQSKIKEKFQVASIKRHDYDQKKEIVDNAKAPPQHKFTVVPATEVSKDDNTSVREIKSAAVHSKALDSRKDSKLRKAEADKETAKVSLCKAVTVDYSQNCGLSYPQIVWCITCVLHGASVFVSIIYEVNHLLIFNYRIE